MTTDRAGRRVHVVSKRCQCTGAVRDTFVYSSSSTL
jgi:hypothetical protein